PSTQHITHVFHTADPIPMGVCTGVTSSCGIAGYAMETRCHLGKVIRYDTVTHLNWLLNEDWTQEGQEGRTVPKAKADGEDCVKAETFINIAHIPQTRAAKLDNDHIKRICPAGSDAVKEWWSRAPLEI
ncbi:hypothetical protein BD769DRAFT_1386989, partial [Suillus cothurnatus]